MKKLTSLFASFLSPAAGTVCFANIGEVTSVTGNKSYFADVAIANRFNLVVIGSAATNITPSAANTDAPLGVCTDSPESSNLDLPVNVALLGCSNGTLKVVLGGTVAGGYTSFGEVFTGCFALGGGDANISGHQGPCFCLVNMSGFKWDGGYMAPTDIKFDGNASAYPNSFTAYNTIRSFGTYTSPACVTTIINSAYAQIQIEPNDSTNVVMTNAFNQWFQGTVAINALNLGKTNPAPTFAAGTTVPRLWFPVTNGVTVFYLPGY